MSNPMVKEPTIKGIDFNLTALEGKTTKEVIETAAKGMKLLHDAWVYYGHGHFNVVFVDNGDSVAVQWHELPFDLQEMMPPLRKLSDKTEAANAV